MANETQTTNGEEISLGKRVTVRGYDIKALPLGNYVRLFGRLKDLPADFLKACFPDKNADEIFAAIEAMDEAVLLDMLPQVLSFVPGYALGFISDVSGVPVDRLENDVNIGLKGFAEIIDAIIKVNELGEAVAMFKGMAKNLAGLFGYKS